MALPLDRTRFPSDVEAADPTSPPPAPPTTAAVTRDATPDAPAPAVPWSLRLVQVAWVALLVGGEVLAAVRGPAEGSPPAWHVALGLGVWVVGLVATVGVLTRRRYGLRASLLWAVPAAGLLLECLIRHGNVEVYSQAVAYAAIVAGTLHPASWRAVR